MKTLSIIIPAYNEEKRIRNTLDSYLKFFSKNLKNFEMIVVLNGCSDNTISVVKSFIKKSKKLKYLDFKDKIGKGGAIIEGFKIAKSSLIGFVDADLSTTPDSFYDLVLKIKNNDGVIASRWIKGSKVYPKQSILRRASGRTFNILMRSLFLMKYRDTQTGAKLFKKKTIKKVINRLGITKWAFDVDLLYQMKKHHFKIIEIPTIWHDKPGSRLKIFKAVPEMFLGLIRLRLVYSRFKFIVDYYDRLPEWLKIHKKLL